MAERHDNTNDVLETARVREVVGVVRSRETLATIVERLTTVGFDRADIDLMASQEMIARELKTAGADSVSAVDMPGVPRRNLVTPSDKETLNVGLFGTLVSLGSMGAALPIVASGGALAAAVAAAIAGGAAAGGIAELIRKSIAMRSDDVHLDDELRQGGLVIFVRASNPEHEFKALSVMRDCGADRVHVHEIDLPKRVQDIPLAKIAPDPWLGPDTPA